MTNTNPAASQPGEPVKRWCETCEGTGYVFQEPQFGCHVWGNRPCPDCDGNGYWFASQPPAGFAMVPIKPTCEMEQVFDQEGWAWADVLAAACAITEQEYESAQPPAASPPDEAVYLRSLLAQYVEADEDRLGWTQCKKSQLYREAMKALDAAVQGKK